MSARRHVAAALLAVLLSCVEAVAAQAPPVLRGIGVTEHRGAQVPLDVALVDHRGKSVTLGHYFDGKRPVVLVLAYYRCPMLCSLVLDGVAKAMRAAGKRPGTDFVAVTVSIDPKETPEEALGKRQKVMKHFASPPADDAWPFLVGGAADVKRIAAAVGFHYRYDPRSGQYAHPAVEFLLTPDGRISRYLYGFDPEPDELAAGLATAAAGDTGRSVQRLLLTCFRYTPSLRRYAGAVNIFLKLGAVSILFAVVGIVWLGQRRARRGGRRG
jgi:protein SCO1